MNQEPAPTQNPYAPLQDGFDIDQHDGEGDGFEFTQNLVGTPTQPQPPVGTPPQAPVGTPGVSPPPGFGFASPAPVTQASGAQQSNLL